MPVSLKKRMKSGICSTKVTPVISAIQSISTSLSVTTVPSERAKGTPSYRANTPQRVTSPTLGSSKLPA